MLHNLVELELLFALLNRLRRLNIVVLHLLSVETSGLEILHRLTTLLCVVVVVLDIAHHSLSTIGVECLL